ncbi:MAG: isoprenylcysteine carboxylmethyltransferase family protein [Anaerolineales bacterium]|nr:isoprenylcysteine carboxylmethyltransferase family protein [Anaerolineales bacterium]
MLKHIQAVLILPVMVTVVIPGLLILTAEPGKTGWALSLPLNWLALLGGVLFVSAGLILLFKTISLFATIGQGTLAPWFATRKLVVQGIYQYVRNPMISGVFCILLGEVLIFGSTILLTWFFMVVIINLIYIPLFEEPGLERRFGADYGLYKQNVPRWIPRLAPWQPPGGKVRMSENTSGSLASGEVEEK